MILDNQQPDEFGSFSVPGYTPTDWERAVAVIEAFGAKIILPEDMASHDFKDNSDCSKCGCYGPTEENLPCIEGKTVAGTVNGEGEWEPMISIPISEYEELMEIKVMYEGLCK